MPPEKRADNMTLAECEDAYADMLRAFNKCKGLWARDIAATAPRCRLGHRPKAARVLPGHYCLPSVSRRDPQGGTLFLYFFSPPRGRRRALDVPRWGIARACWTWPLDVAAPRGLQATFTPAPDPTPGRSDKAPKTTRHAPPWGPPGYHRHATRGHRFHPWKIAAQGHRWIIATLANRSGRAKVSTLPRERQPPVTRPTKPRR